MTKSKHYSSYITDARLEKIDQLFQIFLLKFFSVVGVILHKKTILGRLPSMCTPGIYLKFQLYLLAPLFVN